MVTMMNETTRHTLIFTLLMLLLLTFGSWGEAAMQAAYQYNLANFSGTVPSLWARVAIDRERTEIVALDPRKRDIRIFNEVGMEIFEFGENVQLAGATDIELDEDGNIYLVYPRARQHKLLRLDYKGESLATIGLINVPEDFLPFQPERLQYLEGMFYLADMAAMNIIVIDTEGNFQKGYHARKILMRSQYEFDGHPGEDVFKDPKRTEFLDLAGFSVDWDGNMYFTISTLFSAFKLHENGELQMFGRAGSGPGKFGVVAGIATDARGNIYVTDRLRSVVMIFDSSFNFLTEFGYRGVRPGRLIVPDDVIVDDEKGFIYVAQAANRGVSVYRIILD